MSSPRPQPAVPPTEVRVGDYQLLSKIGEGGMGVVHLARGRDGRRVALKVLRPHIIGDDEARERLAREVSSLSRVRSPRIAEVIDADPWGDTPYVATRYVPGLSLHEHVRNEGVLAGDDLRHFAAGLAEAVIAVHSVGVLHRDIKPSNVILEGRSPVLIDFGLARLADDPRLTVTGYLVGTPGYLAPEILYGDDPTPAADVHAWAATVVLAATGSPPFGRGPAVAIMDRVRRGEHDLSQVPGDLLPLLRQCLAADPHERPGMQAALDVIVHGAPVPMLGDDTATTQLPVDDRAAVTEQLGDDVLSIFGGAETMPMSAPTARLPQHPTTPLTVGATTPLTVGATTPLTVAAAAAAPSAPPLPPAPSVLQPARAPYMEPPPPRDDLYRSDPSGYDDEESDPYLDDDEEDEGQVDQFTPSTPTPLTAGQRFLKAWLLLAGLVALALAFAAAPYLVVVCAAVTVLLLRTGAITGERKQIRQWRRGRPRWYDGPLAVLGTPWYLLLAVGGTVLLLAWAAMWTVAVGGVLVLAGEPEPVALGAGGVALGLALWWGPGAKRLRTPLRAMARGSARVSLVGWLLLFVLAGFAALAGLTVADGGTTWDPQPGPPWRPGTLLGTVADRMP